MDTRTEAKPTMTISAVVTRANGDVEDLGIIATTEPNPGIVRQLKEAWVEGWHKGKDSTRDGVKE